MDRIDLAILRELTQDGRLPVKIVAERVGLSKSPTQERMRRLERDGVILGYRAILDPAKVGLDQVAFVEVKLRDTSEAALRAFNAAIRTIPEIEECHMIAGAFDYLLKVRTANIRAYRAVLGERIGSLPHVASTSTHVSMQAVKDDARVMPSG
jgi:Lrp/AsnC family leucine-responsive transcriptional regulator